MKVAETALTAAAITQGLETRVLGKAVHCYERVESTNDIARKLAKAGAADGSVILAEEQTAGRGRMARSWIAPPYSSILMSLLLRPALAPPQLARVTMAAALGVCDAIGSETGLEAAIKWPNDIVIDGKKCAGILAEGESAGDQVDYVIVGLGLNVNFRSGSVEGIPEDATTLADELQRPVPRAGLVRAILTAVEHYYLRLQAGTSLRADWAQRMVTLGRMVHARTPWGEESGTAEAVEEDGALLLRRADGYLARLVAADVTLADVKAR
jgi:BirA family biotin operon repressor/biotin-[acetyl-CoA-carboxylase] ligase